MEKPKVGGKSPIREELEGGKDYYWCTCGASTTQPWCNGSHKGTGFTPQVVTLPNNKKVSLCTCKLTSNPPYCDGAHKGL